MVNYYNVSAIGGWNKNEYLRDDKTKCQAKLTF